MYMFDLIMQRVGYFFKKKKSTFYNRLLLQGQEEVAEAGVQWEPT